MSAADSGSTGVTNRDESAPNPAEQEVDKAKNSVAQSEAKVNPGETLYQSGAPESPRGWFRILPDGSIEIGKTPFGDASTPVHEALGHASYYMLSELAGHEGASDQLKSDLGTVHEWMGVKEGEVPNRTQLERYSRAVELYFTKGKPPTAALENTFHRIAVWISSAYKNAVKTLGVKITPELHDVMDRWFAGTDAVNRAESVSGPRLFKNAEEAGWTEEKFQKYAEDNRMSVAEAQSKIIGALNEAAIRDPALNVHVVVEFRLPPTDELPYWSHQAAGDPAFCGERTGLRGLKEECVQPHHWR